LHTRKESSEQLEDSSDDYHDLITSEYHIKFIAIGELHRQLKLTIPFFSGKSAAGNQQTTVCIAATSTGKKPTSKIHKRK
jgi:hypothetical protein